MAGKRVSVTSPPPPGSIANSSSLLPSLGTRARQARWRQLMRSCGIAPTGDSSSRSVARASSDTYGQRATPTVQSISRTKFSGALPCWCCGRFGMGQRRASEGRAGDDEKQNRQKPNVCRSIRRGKAGRLDIRECSKRNKLAPSVLLGLLGLHGLRSTGSCIQKHLSCPNPRPVCCNSTTKCRRQLWCNPRLR